MQRIIMCYGSHYRSLRRHRDRVNAAGKGADVNAKDYNGTTALIMAIRNGYTEIVSRLLEKGADVNAKDYNGNFTARHSN